MLILTSFVTMKFSCSNISFSKCIKPVVLSILLLVGIGAFATLGDGKKKATVSSKKLLSSKSQNFSGTFSLRSGYSFRGNTILEPEQKIILRINTDVSVGKGNNSFTVPLRGHAILSKLKIELGNRSLRQN